MTFTLFNPGGEPLPRGQLIPDVDLMIAATALHHNLTLLTFNRRDVERVPDLMPYQAG